MELAKNFKNSIPGGVADPIPDGDDITGNDNNIDSNHLSPNPSIADQIEAFVTSPSPKIVITHDSPTVSNQPTNNHSLPRVVPLPIYDEGTVNPNIRRRKAKKKALARDSFPAQAVETVNNEIPILPPTPGRGYLNSSLSASN